MARKKKCPPVKCPLCHNDCIEETGVDDRGRPVINYVCQTEGDATTPRCDNFEQTVAQIPDPNPDPSSM